MSPFDKLLATIVRAAYRTDDETPYTADAPETPVQALPKDEGDSGQVGPKEPA